MLLFTPGNMLQLFRERRGRSNSGKIDLPDSRCIGGTEYRRDIPRVLDILEDNPNILASFPHMLKKLLSLFFPELPHDDLRIRDIARNVNSKDLEKCFTQAVEQIDLELLVLVLY